MERDRIARVPPAGVGTSGAGRLPTQVSLTLPEACWATRADFGRASMELRESKSKSTLVGSRVGSAKRV